MLVGWGQEERVSNFSTRKFPSFGSRRGGLMLILKKKHHVDLDLVCPDMLLATARSASQITSFSMNYCSLQNPVHALSCPFQKLQKMWSVDMILLQERLQVVDQSQK